jgi:hypothetical protein
MNRNKNRAIFFGVLGMMGGSIIMGLGFSISSNNDMQGEKVDQNKCAVTDKHVSQRSRGQAQERYNYHVDSTCGKFSADKGTYNQLELDHTYNFVTTAGNWANKATIVSFTETH